MIGAWLLVRRQREYADLEAQLTEWAQAIDERTLRPLDGVWV